MLHKKALWTGLSFLFAFLLCFSIILGLILEQFSSNVDDFLGTKSSTMESDEGDELYGVYTPNDLYVNKDADGNITSGNSKAMIQAAIDLGEQEGAEGTVLLKNTGVLPLKTGSNVTLLGLRSHEPLLGAGVGIQVWGPVITLEDALSRTTTDWTNSAKWMDSSSMTEMDTFEFTGAGYNLNSSAISYYESFNSTAKYSYGDGILNFTNTEPSSSELSSISTTGYQDAIIVVIGRPGAEAVDYTIGDDGTDPLTLTENEKAAIEYAKSQTSNNGNVIILINSCNNINGLDAYKEDSGIGAILNIGFPGCYGMLGVADVLCGNATPSGALADIAAANNLSAPASQNMGDYTFTNPTSGSGSDVISRKKYSTNYVMEAESIYTGYRYYETRYEDSVLYNSQSNATTLTSDKRDAGSSSASSWDYENEVAYGFGYGLSYTTFTQEIQTDDIKVNDDRANNSITIDIPVKVTNTGTEYSGKSIVQIYGQAPYYLNDSGKTSSVEKTSIELLGFAKTGILAANGGEETVTVTIDLQNIASYDSTANEGKGGYIMDEGDYYFAVGNGAHDALNNIILTKDSNATIEADVDRTGVDVEASVYKYTFSSEEGEIDQTTFSTSKAGVTVENQIPYADFNYYQEGGETFLSRSSWSATFPTEYKDVTAPSSMLADLNGTGGNYYQTTAGAKDSQGNDASSYTWGSKTTSHMFYELTQSSWEYTDEGGNDVWDQALSQITMGEAMYLNAYGGPTLPAASSLGMVAYYLVENNGNGIVYSFSSNKESSACPWFITEEKNSGWNGECFGSSTLLAQAFNPELALRRGEFVGNESLFLGIPIIWGPGLNTHRTAYCGRTCEYYSEDPILTGIVAEYYSYGAAEYGLLDAPKHFAFNDQETNRAGIAPFMSEQRAREVELRAFQIAIESPDMDKIAAIAANPEQISPNYEGMFGVMTSYSKIGAVECTCSRGLLTGILRGEWGFHGYTVTDNTDDTDLYTPAVYAGITGYDNRGVTSFDTSSPLSDSYSDFAAKKQVSGETLDDTLYSNDAAMMEAIRTNNKNLLWALSQTNLMNKYSASTHLVSHMVWWRALYIVLIVVFAVLTAAAVVLYVLTYVFKKNDTTAVDKN